MDIPTTFQSAGPFNIGGPEIVILAAVFKFVAIFFLVRLFIKTLPKIAKAFGEGLAKTNRQNNVVIPSHSDSV